jgi:hypothetical protein
MIRLKSLLSFGDSLDPSCMSDSHSYPQRPNDISMGQRQRRSLDNPRALRDHDLRQPPRSSPPPEALPQTALLRL